VTLAAATYKRDMIEQPLRPDEILQMFGRAGRRGIDEVGYVLVNQNEVRLRDGYPAHLSRSGMVDWNALLGLMSAAAKHGKDPFTEAVEVQKRLFTTKPILLGVEESMKNPNVPCGLMTDAERARHVRKRVRQMLNSKGDWELTPAGTEKALRDVKVMEPIPESALNLLKLRTSAAQQEAATPKMDEAEAIAPEAGTLARDDMADTALSAIVLRPALSMAEALEKVGQGLLCAVGEEEGQKIYGRCTMVAERAGHDRVILVKWVRRLTNWHGREATLVQWNEKIAPIFSKRMTERHTPVVRFEDDEQKITAVLSLADLTMRVPVDAHGVAIWKPIEREVVPRDCAVCALVPVCLRLPTSTGVAMLWRRLGLVDTAGVPTKRGRIVSFFSQGDGLAVAAALEEERYPIDELVYDLANLDAGFRFAHEENRWGGRLAIACQRTYGVQSIPGYLENGVPPRYGWGASEVVQDIHKDPLSKNRWVTEFLGPGDIDRVIIEWRSMLRRIAHSPELDWARWTALQQLAKTILNETESPTMTDLPKLEYAQTKRIEHRLVFRRH
jgi:hypothetical protein